MMSFKTTKAVITLGDKDLVRLQEVLMDADKEGAFSYLEDVIAEKVRCAQVDSHRPDFEGGKGNVPAHHLQKGEGHPDVGESG